jgi:hypothetical protein
MVGDDDSGPDESKVIWILRGLFRVAVDNPKNAGAHH